MTHGHKTEPCCIRFPAILEVMDTLFFFFGCASFRKIWPCICQVEHVCSGYLGIPRSRRWSRPTPVPARYSGGFTGFLSRWHWLHPASVRDVQGVVMGILQWPICVTSRCELACVKKREDGESERAVNGRRDQNTFTYRRIRLMAPLLIAALAQAPPWPRWALDERTSQGSIGGWAACMVECGGRDLSIYTST